MCKTCIDGICSNGCQRQRVELRAEVTLVTLSVRQTDGTFRNEEPQVFSNREMALSSLKKIYDRYNQKENEYEDWQARWPVSSNDSLFLDLKVGDRYSCKYFYKVSTRPVM